MEILYTATAHADRSGEAGHVRTEDDRLDLETHQPAQSESTDSGVNAEQLLAAALATSYLNAIHTAAIELDAVADDSAVSAVVSVGRDAEGFALQVELVVHIPNVDDDAQQKLTDRASQICPITSAMRESVEVTRELVE